MKDLILVLTGFLFAINFAGVIVTAWVAVEAFGEFVASIWI